MKVTDILNLDLNKKENVKKLVHSYLKIKYVDKHIKDKSIVHEMDNFEDLGNIYNIALYVISKTKFNNPSMFNIDGKITSNLKDELSGDFYTVYAKTIKEYYIKLAVFCYYFRKHQNK